NSQQRKSSLSQPAARDCCLAMHEFSATFRRVTEVLSRKRIDAATTSVSRLQNSHPLAGAPKLAGRHQACGSGANDDDVFCLWSSHAGALLTVHQFFSARNRYPSDIAPPSSR